MNTAIIAYDLKNVKPGDNTRVKEALVLRFTNTYTHLDGANNLSVFPEWVRLRFPDTTIFVDNSTASAQAMVADVNHTILSVGAEPDAIFVAYVGENYLWNSAKNVLS